MCKQSFNIKCNDELTFVNTLGDREDERSQIPVKNKCF